jgi:DNA-binding NarL/FixJ family response regulator
MKNLRILLADDHPLLRKGLAAALKKGKTVLNFAP